MRVRDLVMRVRIRTAKKLIAKRQEQVKAGLITRTQKKIRERFRRPIKITLVQDFWVHPGEPPSVYYAQGGQSKTQVRVEDPAVYAQVMRVFNQKRAVVAEIMNSKKPLA